MLNILLFPAFASASSEGQKVILPTSYRLLKFKMRNSSHEDVAREVLLSLGVPEGIANGMQNSEILENVYNASDLNSYTEYTKIKPDGTSVEISKAQCLKEVAALQRSATTLSNNNAYNEDTDKYFKKTILAIWVADIESYLYWTCFEWLSIPFFTAIDVCGINSTDGSIVENSGFAAFSYDINKPGEHEEYYKEYSYEDPNDKSHFKQFDRTLTFKFLLPHSYEDNLCSNISVAVITAGAPSSLTEQRNYNIYGTYYHRIFTLVPVTTINPIAGNIGFTVTPTAEYKSYNINTEIRYYP